MSFSLTRMGVRKGDVIAVSSENRREYWSTVVGIICSGAVVTTINIGYTNGKLIWVIRMKLARVNRNTEQESVANFNVIVIC